MSPTRRDLLTAALAAPLVAALPETAKADQPATPRPLVYLSGYTLLKDCANGTPIEGDFLGGNFELYADDRKAIFRVALYEGNRHVAWKEWVTTNPAHMQMMRTLGAMLKEATP